MVMHSLLSIHTNIFLFHFPVLAALLQERVVKCIGLIHSLVLISGSTQGAAMGAVPQSPIGVLDTSCLSYISDETTFISCDDSSYNTPQTKRRKIHR